ncbi:protein transport protein SEC16B homolog [Rutidosis leptorrhynchoides]|uniref:protein transport protein SEC16B homolog n=1 Tax=Rutidosis leptorrhynchoides TaxID=125765 RepID=UPI003A99C41A
MASNPSFMVEDTDEDFFDKLVDDDDDYKVSTLTSVKENNAVVNDDNDSDEAKAFANLSISDSGTGIEDLSPLVTNDLKDEPVNSTNVESSHLVYSNSFAFDNVNEGLDNGNLQLEELLDSTESENPNQNHGSGGTAGVKEVQWSAFASDSVTNGRGAFGSYPDFFTEFGNGSIDQIGKEDNLVSSELNSVVKSSLQVKNVDDHLQTFQTDQAYTAVGGEENVNDFYQQLQGDQVYATAGEQSVNGQDPNSSQNWEELYPGWRYDSNTGQWYQVDETQNATSHAQEASSTYVSSEWTGYNDKSEISYLQQSVQSISGAVAQTGTTESITNWNSVSQTSESSSNSKLGSQDDNNNKVYPSHMVFDPQYPGWYYDMNVQEWRSLDDYNSQSTVVAQGQVNQNGFGSSSTYYANDQKTYGGQGEFEKSQDYNWNGSFNNAEQQSSTTWQPNYVANSVPAADVRNNQQVANHYNNKIHVDNHANQQHIYDYGGTTTSSFNKATQVNNGFPAVSGSQTFVPFSQPLEHSEKMNAVMGYGNQNQLGYSQQPVQSGHQVSYGSRAGKSSAGRPPHALVTFGFGGKLIVMKDSTNVMNASYGGQVSNSGSVSVLNLSEFVTGDAHAHDYIQTLCQQSFPGPLSSGNAGVKELNRWMDERIKLTETADLDYKQGEVVRLLLSLLKIASQHYGKLRSPFGSDPTVKENDVPEVAVARLFASVKNSSEYNNYGSFVQCLQELPSEKQTRETAAEVQTLLVSGRKEDALLRAQDGQLWGPALVLAAQLGDQFYVDTVKKMALRQLVPGSPLRTLCLLIAGQPADVFSAVAAPGGGISGSVNISQQPAHAQISANGMLDDWEDNLAMITANRTKDDELVLIHLGDCLWKERSNIIAAHICYFVADANFEQYSDTARLCLIGADHWNHPRTYASPEAIQRTEVYEYSKMLGNSQFTLLPFQPYKLVYAHMLAEVGRVSDSLKYCQAVTKSLKTGRIPEVETWRQLAISLEDRIKTHQQGGFSANLAPGKIVGKLLNLFDSTAHRVVGGLPPPVPSTSGVSFVPNDYHHQPPKVLTSQSTMAMSSLMPSASMEPINQGDGSNKMMINNRSASEPNFGRSPMQDHDVTSKENSAGSQSKTPGNTSRFSRFSFGSGLFQKTVGMVLKPRQDKQAKLGDQNKFYYDEKLKRWVEEGVDPPAEEAALAPPPTMATFQNGSPDYSLKSALRTESISSGSSEFTSPTPPSHGSGIPPIPATSNQFSARGRTGVRARYVDTFNQGGGGTPTKLFQSPAVPTIQPPKTSGNPKFFVPTAAPTAVPEAEQLADTVPNNLQPSTSSNDQTSSFSYSASPLSAGMPKYPSMDDMSRGGTSTSTSSSLTNQTMSRRTLSWSGSAHQDISVSSNNEFKPFGGYTGTFMPNQTSLAHSSSDDLQEVEL